MSEIYEQIVRDGNKTKQGMRYGVAQIERDLRVTREMVADKQIENKNLQFLV